MMRQKRPPMPPSHSPMQAGQRYISQLDISLGLGIISAIEGRRVSVFFPAADEERSYAIDNAPLSRISYKAGDVITNHEDQAFTVVDALDNQGLIIYQVTDENGDESILPETELNSFIQFNQAKRRLLSGLVDSGKAFELRREALKLHEKYEKSSVQGLLGPRVQLLAHQLYIASRVATRPQARVLLADEVGLGKTIEAGLIMHQRISAGLADRVLVLMPDSLLHQWLVEMLRRFNLHFNVLNEDICAEIEMDGINPFESGQLILCPLSFVTDNPERFEQAANCEWDLLVVDEAHHLTWQEGEPSLAYQCVEELAAIASSVLLLTATPEQAGIESHFARLRLLDPSRYYDLASFIEEEQNYQGINSLLEEIIDWNEDVLQDNIPTLSDTLSQKEIQQLEQVIDEDGFDAAKQKLIDALLDRHGTGRVLFRNTRQAVQGFPERKLHEHPLELHESLALPTDAPIQDWLSIERLMDNNWINLDERIGWLIDFLKSHRDEKILLICHEAQTAVELEEFLRLREAIDSAVFHEGMSLLQRDRAAAWFADLEEGAQVLICSEIGSEGRNFQFANHLIMFDLPYNPDLLEQRIGRLDRIGQTQTINIHVPFYTGTPQQRLLAWYKDGFNAFEQTCSFGHHLFTEQFDALEQALNSNDDSINTLISSTQSLAEDFRQNIEQSRNKLLELNSCRPLEAEDIIDEMLNIEDRRSLESFIEAFCDLFGIESETHSANSIVLRQGDHQRIAIQGLDEEGFTATYSRETALSREDMAFLSWEHPFVKQAFDAMLSSEVGNTNVSTLKIKAIPAGTLLLECIFSIESIAPKALQLQQYTPQSHFRIVINNSGKNLTELLPSAKLTPVLQKIPTTTAQAILKQGEAQIEALVGDAEAIAQKQLPDFIAATKQQAQTQLGIEIERLEALSEVNPNIKPDDTEYIKGKLSLLERFADQITIRTQSLRLIIAT